MSDIDPAVVMAAHTPSWARSLDRGPAWCVSGCHDAEWPCLPYRLAEALAATQGALALEHASLNVTAEALAAEQAKVARASVAESIYQGFTGCTDRNPDVCACSTHEDPYCEVCGESIEAGEKVVDLTRPTYSLMPEDHPEQEWENHTAHARCFHAALADQPERAH